MIFLLTSFITLLDIDKGCSLCCRLEAVNTIEALWGFSLEPRQQFVLSSRYNQINYIKCKHFILWSGPECVHKWSLQRHNSCKPQPRIKKKNPEEIVLPCLDNINFMWFFYIEKRKRFLVQFTGHWTPDPRQDRAYPTWRKEQRYISSIFRILLFRFLQMPCPESSLIIFSQFEKMLMLNRK